MLGNLLNTGFGRFDRWQDNRLKLDCKFGLAASQQILSAIGCPCVELTLVSRSKRAAKISRLMIGVKGEGFLAEIQKGFSQQLISSDISIKKEAGEIFFVNCLPIDKSNDQHGWVLNQDDVARFIYPVAHMMSPIVATALCENICVVAVTFDKQQIEVADGTGFQPLVQTLLDDCIQRRLGCLATLEYSVKVITDKPVSMGPVGAINENPISFPDNYPTPEDFQTDAGEGKQ